MAGAAGRVATGQSGVFVDETGASTKMTRLYGRCRRGERLVAPVPWGYWKTTTFVGALRQDGLVAPCAFDGPINGGTFRALLEQFPRSRAQARRYRHPGQSAAMPPGALLERPDDLVVDSAHRQIGHTSERFPAGAPALGDPREAAPRKTSRPMSQDAGPSRHVLMNGPQWKEMTMTPRLNAFAAAPGPMKAWLDFSRGLHECGLEASLMDLVVTRASQINGCAFCLDMHTADARKRGETEQRLYLLDAWRDSPLFSDRERAALAWTEALTLLAETRAPDDVYRTLKAQFSDEEQVKLTLLIVAINGWNRINVGFRTVHPLEQRRAA
jgi:AhpD family alkylhydroperoxidase